MTTGFARVPPCRWGIGTPLAITGLLLLAYILILAVAFPFGDSPWASKITSLAAAAATVLVPYLWVTQRMDLRLDQIGLRGGRFSIRRTAMIGVGVGLFYSLAYRLSPWWQDPALIEKEFSLLHLILIPLSIQGVGSIVLSPIGEEMLDRGLYYGYLRQKIGVPLAIGAQALISSALHLSFTADDAATLFVSRAIAALLFGVLYESTGSLYTSMLCHAVINYTAIAMSVKWVI